MRETSVLLLAAGFGTRLRPLTDHWPKCLMPIARRPLLEYWLATVTLLGFKDIFINLHYQADIVRKFLERPQFKGMFKLTYEVKLLGTAGTLRKNAELFHDKTVLLVHADNLCCCDFFHFIEFHQFSRPANTVMTMMTFESQDPASCGIVELDELGVVQNFHEKVKNPPNNLANGAVYLLEEEVLDWIKAHPEISDFSTEVLPKFIGKIATWQNKGVHRDIGSIGMLKEAQSDNCALPPWTDDDEWQDEFLNHPIHNEIEILFNE